MWFDSKERIHAPEIGRRWINSPALTMRQLRGRVVLVDFWDYTCINCIHTLPYVKEWDRRYRSAGLTVIGVHTPEFHFARTEDYVERAVQRFGLEFPVVMDNDYQIWQSYANRCWPAKYLIDASGYVRYCHFGEGAYRETEEAIQQLLREIDPHFALPPLVHPLREADRPGARCLPVTPELYLGFQRGRLGNESGYAADVVKDYQAGSDFVPEHAYLEGPWFAGREAIAACPLEKRPSKLLVPYRAAEVNLVMSPPESGEAEAIILADGAPLSGDTAGEDIVCKGGHSVVALKEPRMYRLIESDQVESRVLGLCTFTPGLEAYALTFVSGCV